MWHVSRLQREAQRWDVRLAGKITAFDGITVGRAQAESIKKQFDIVHISKINKLRADPARPSTALYYRPLLLNCCSSTISHPLVPCVWTQAAFLSPWDASVKDGGGECCTAPHTPTCYFPGSLQDRDQTELTLLWRGRDTGRGRVTKDED